jgi:hypothetical protein
VSEDEIARRPDMPETGPIVVNIDRWCPALAVSGVASELMGCLSIM